jgi:hypothetical protein
VLVAFATATLTVLWGAVVVVVLVAVPWWPALVVVVWATVVVVAPWAAVVVVEPEAAAVVVVVEEATLTLGRVPTATRMATPTTNKTRTRPARTTDNLADESVSCPSASIRDQPAVRTRPVQAFALVVPL